MKKAFYPPLLATFLVLALFNANIHRIASPREAAIPLLIAVGLSGVIWLALRFALKSWKRAALPTCLTTIGLLEYGHFRNVFGLEGTLTLTIWIAAFTMIVLATIAIVRKPPTIALNIIAVCLVITTLIPFSAFVLRSSTSQVRIDDTAKVEGDSNTPDIYYIIVDEYSRDDLLLDMFGFDNSEFINYLEATGFYVAEDSYANYPHTILSLPSTLDMDYLPEEYNPYTADRMLCSFWATEVPKFLKQRGYTLVNISTFFRSEDVDIDYNYDKYNEFTLLFHEMSIFYVEGTSDRHAYKCTQYKFDKLIQVPQIPEPTFTFMHLMITHAPYVHNKDGSYRGHRALPNEEWYKAYIDQIQAVNTMLQETVNTILAEGNAVIIIQADTGTQPCGYLKYRLDCNGMFDNIMQEEPLIVRNRLAILSTIYPAISDDFNSPVNTFRIIFNYYFSTDYKILPDRYFWTVKDYPPYRTFEVTDTLKSMRRR